MLFRVGQYNVVKDHMIPADIFKLLCLYMFLISVLVRECPSTVSLLQFMIVKGNTKPERQKNKEQRLCA